MKKDELYDPYQDYVKMHNNFVNAKGKSSLLMLKLITTGIAFLKSDEEGNIEATITGTELKSIFGSKSHSLYGQIHDLVEPPSKNMPSILDYRQIYLDPESQEIDAYNVITRANFKNNVLTIRFNKDLKSILYGFKKNYTRLNLGVLMNFKSVYSYRLYQILKAEYDKMDGIEKLNGRPSRQSYTIQMDLVDLKMRIGVIDSSTPKVVEALRRCDYETVDALTSLDEEASRYKDYGNLRKNALEKAKTEIDNSEKAEIYFEYCPIRTGRGGKTTGVSFKIYSKNPKFKEKEKDVTVTDQEKILDEIGDIIEEKLKPSEYRAIAEAAEYDICKVKKAYEVLKSSKNTRNIVGFLIKAIEEDYEIPTPRMETHTFTGFEQRKVNLDELEKELLSN